MGIGIKGFGGTSGGVKGAKLLPPAAAAAADIFQVPYVTTATDYNSTTDYYVRASDLDGNTDGELGIASFWLKLEGGNGTNRYIYSRNPSTRPRIFLNTGNLLAFVLHNSSGNSSVEIESNTTFTSGSGWHHILAAWDGSINDIRLYVDGVADSLNFIQFNSAGPIAYTGTNHHIGTAGFAPGSIGMNGCLSELYFNFDETIDLTVESNRLKFRDAGGKPVSLSSDGSKPTGTAPIMYFPDGSAATNAGTGGNFSVQGSPGVCVDSPSD